MVRLGRDAWVRLIAEYEVSGQTQREFAAKQQVKLATLRSWLYALRREGKPQRFVPVTVVARAPEPRSSTPGMLELATRQGLVLRFPEGTDPQYLAALLVELG
jgi:hypothetical protein